jgi:hypothetical protein
MTQRRLRLMAEYECFPLWETTESGLLNLAPEQLPISQDLQAALRAWAMLWEATYNRADPIKSGFPDDSATQRFVAQGHRLWQRLRTELDGGFEITYYSVVEDRPLTA